ncbi:MAG: MAPEG family protein [Pseudomonadota bacterium]
MLASELSILAIYGLIVAITLLLQATGALLQLDMGYLLSSRDEGRTVTGMAARTERALSNSVTAMALFAPAILILAVKDAFSAQSLLAAQVFLAARVIYLPSYVFGIIGIRSLAWTVGFFATIVLYFLAL